MGVKSIKEEDKKLEEKKSTGRMLLDYVLEKTNKTEDELYEVFEKKFDNFKIFGDTKEKALLNYCTYRGDSVERAFGLDRR